mgnify:CR=1 FL=1
MYYYAFYILLIVLTILLFIRSYRVFVSFRRFCTFLLMLMLCGLFYNLFVIGFGDATTSGKLLMKLSHGRTLLQGVFSPLAVIIGIQIARRFEAPVLNRKRSILTGWIFMLLMIALAIRYQFSLELEPIAYYDHLRYEPVTQQELYLISATTGFILLFVSLLVYEKQQYALFFGIVLIVLIGFALMRLLAGSKIYLINDLLDFMLLAGLYKADKDSLVFANEKGQIYENSR